jgi:transposase
MPRGRILDLRWNALLNEFRRSGLTQAEFCQRRSISLHSFRKRLYQKPTPKPIPANPPADAAPHFLPVTILPDPNLVGAATTHALELVFSNGRRIAVAPGFDPQTLRRLLAVVEDRPCSD